VLPPYIIERIRERERRDHGAEEQPRVELPVPPGKPEVPREHADDESDRGLVEIQIWG
jgi:hypothetical protein